MLVDLRGYGESSKPKGSEEHKEYSKSTMVGFCVLFTFWWCVMVFLFVYSMGLV